MPTRHTMASLALTGLFAIACQSALAAPARIHTLKPGLWQIESQTWLHGHAVPDMNALIGMGPDALQTHVQNMLRQNHVRIDGNGIATICVSAGQIAQNDFVNDQGSGCTVGAGNRTGNNIRFDIRCDAPKGRGYTNVTLVSPTKWVSYSKADLTIRKLNQNITNQSFGTWLGETCPAGQ